MTPRTGRPKSDNPRDKPLSTWVTEEEKKLVEAAAKDAQQPLSTWLRELSMTAARKAERARRKAEIVQPSPPKVE